MSVRSVAFSSTLSFPLRTPAMVRHALSQELSQTIAQSARELETPIEARVFVPFAHTNGDVFRRTFNPNGQHSATVVSPLRLELSTSGNDRNRDGALYTKIFASFHGHELPINHWPNQLPAPKPFTPGQENGDKPLYMASFTGNPGFAY